MKFVLDESDIKDALVSWIYSEHGVEVEKTDIKLWGNGDDGYEVEVDDEG